ncbi:TonB-dependent receptor [Sphingomonas sp. BIUV-7]|uniref:TonB-dependent receptor n=1 Tax=Sphingomonas natans TaxID=3063330 RepID=A0ABT8YEK6_9SPHN|nr:TonB-dependent receptor [Sphingomonas sp. BIUV-7]
MDTARADDDILVTGSRIRGALIASPVIRLSQDDMRNAGQTSLGDVVRSIPQSFGGGQNPGVGTNVPVTRGVDVGGGSSINLRGLGSDATLTLLNGHRLSYSASRQSIDVSSIPLDAVDRIEIVPDGASALYGSDAVAGVANIVLKRDFAGLRTSARLGTSTDGGDFSQQYGAVAGRTWGSGGIIAAYEFNRSTSITSADRSYAATRSPGLTLFPALKRHSATISGHQVLATDLTLDLDALYNKRWSVSSFPLNAAGNLAVSSGTSYSTAESLVVAPTLRVAMGSDWQTALTGSYGRDHVRYGVDVNFAGVVSNAGSGCYCNSAKSAELNGDGTLFRMPGGHAKLALGAGYRRNDFTSFRGAGNYRNVSKSQDSYYGFGEINLPLVSPAQGIALVSLLNVSAAIRYENYPGTGSVATPKLGTVYAPTPDFLLRASWGKSFRAPTLLQRYDPQSVTLNRATSVGGSGFPAGATVLTVQGGNSELKPERATNWSAGIDLHPRTVAGFHLEVSYFSTQYRDRIVDPVALLSVALSNPIYRDQVMLNPTDAAKANALAAAGTFLNAAGAPYDPAKVVALIDDASVNAGRQTIHGADLLLRLDKALGDRAGSLHALLNATYLASKQQISSLQPVVTLAGTLFNPPHVRTRGGLGWSDGPVSLTSTVNYIGSIRDTRFHPSPRIASLTTLDLSARVQTDGEAGLFRNLDLTLSLLNATNAKPAAIAISSFTDTPYDSTNFSPVGRFIALGIARRW